MCVHGVSIYQKFVVKLLTLSAFLGSAAISVFAEDNICARISDPSFRNCCHSAQQAEMTYVLLCTKDLPGASARQSEAECSRLRTAKERGMALAFAGDHSAREQTHRRQAKALGERYDENAAYITGDLRKVRTLCTTDRYDEWPLDVFTTKMTADWRNVDSKLDDDLRAWARETTLLYLSGKEQIKITFFPYQKSSSLDEPKSAAPAVTSKETDDRKLSELVQLLVEEFSGRCEPLGLDSYNKWAAGINSEWELVAEAFRKYREEPDKQRLIYDPDVLPLELNLVGCLSENLQHDYSQNSLASTLKSELAFSQPYGAVRTLYALLTYDPEGPCAKEVNAVFKARYSGTRDEAAALFERQKSFYETYNPRLEDIQRRLNEGPPTTEIPPIERSVVPIENRYIDLIAPKILRHLRDAADLTATEFRPGFLDWVYSASEIGGAAQRTLQGLAERSEALEKVRGRNEVVTTFTEKVCRYCRDQVALGECGPDESERKPVASWPVKDGELEQSLDQFSLTNRQLLGFGGVLKFNSVHEGGSDIDLFLRQQPVGGEYVSGPHARSQPRVDADGEEFAWLGDRFWMYQNIRKSHLLFGSESWVMNTPLIETKDCTETIRSIIAKRILLDLYQWQSLTESAGNALVTRIQNEQARFPQQCDAAATRLTEVADQLGDPEAKRKVETVIQDMRRRGATQGK